MIALNDTQLVIIDIQGKLSQIVHESERVLYNSRIMIEGCRLLGIPIVWLEQLPEKLGVGPPPFPLATTLGITFVFFSSAY